MLTCDEILSSAILWRGGQDVGKHHMTGVRSPKRHSSNVFPAVLNSETATSDLPEPIIRSNNRRQSASHQWNVFRNIGSSHDRHPHTVLGYPGGMQPQLWISRALRLTQPRMVGISRTD